MDAELFKRRINRLKRTCEVIENTMSDEYFKDKPDYLRSLAMLLVPGRLIKMKRNIKVLCRQVKL